MQPCTGPFRVGQCPCAGVGPRLSWNHLEVSLVLCFTLVDRDFSSNGFCYGPTVVHGLQKPGTRAMMRYCTEIWRIYDFTKIKISTMLHMLISLVMLPMTEFVWSKHLLSPWLFPSCRVAGITADLLHIALSVSSPAPSPVLFQLSLACIFPSCFRSSSLHFPEIFVLNTFLGMWTHTRTSSISVIFFLEASLFVGCVRSWTCLCVSFRVKGTTDAIFIVRQIMEKHLAKKKNMHLTFVDLEKEFDSVPREVRRWAMRKSCVGEWLVQGVMRKSGVEWLVQAVMRKSGVEWLVQGAMRKSCVGEWLVQGVMVLYSGARTVVGRGADDSRSFMLKVQRLATFHYLDDEGGEKRTALGVAVPGQYVVGVRYIKVIVYVYAQKHTILWHRYCDNTFTVITMNIPTRLLLRQNIKHKSPRLFITHYPIEFLTWNYYISFTPKMSVPLLEQASVGCSEQPEGSLPRCPTLNGVSPSSRSRYAEELHSSAWRAVPSPWVQVPVRWRLDQRQRSAPTLGLPLGPAEQRRFLDWRWRISRCVSSVQTLHDRTNPSSRASLNSTRLWSRNQPEAYPWRQTLHGRHRCLSVDDSCRRS